MGAVAVGDESGDPRGDKSGGRRVEGGKEQPPHGRHLVLGADQGQREHDAAVAVGIEPKVGQRAPPDVLQRRPAGNGAVGKDGRAVTVAVDVDAAAAATVAASGQARRRGRGGDHDGRLVLAAAASQYAVVADVQTGPLVEGGPGLLRRGQRMVQPNVGDVDADVGLERGAHATVLAGAAERALEALAAKLLLRHVQAKRPVVARKL